MMSLLLLTKPTSWSRAAQATARRLFPHAVVIEGERGTPLPVQVTEWRGDVLLSFLCPWVLPDPVLHAASRAAVNFHPAPPEYPGIGCYNFALYEGADTYGVTCHHMIKRVDAGPIIDVRRFAILPVDTVESLKERSMAEQLIQFTDIVGRIALGEALPGVDEGWRGTARTRRELDQLCRIDITASPTEVERRIRATFFPGMAGPYVEVGGRRFAYQPDEQPVSR
jgi:methionyl-tRNA formyltransferase